MFEIGNIVKLKSGGPDMTVTIVWSNTIMIKGSRDYQCMWFDDDSHVQTADFFHDTVKESGGLFE